MQVQQHTQPGALVGLVWCWVSRSTERGGVRGPTAVSQSKGDDSKPLVLPAAEKGRPSCFLTLSPEEMHWSSGPWLLLPHEQAVPRGGDLGTLCFVCLSAWAVPWDMLGEASHI